MDRIDKASRMDCYTSWTKNPTALTDGLKWVTLNVFQHLI